MDVSLVRRQQVRISRAVCVAGFFGEGICVVNLNLEFAR